MRIIAGSLKNRKIPFQNSKFNNAETTPQKVKGALFSLLGEDLSGKSFLDLYSCSGQIGLEAVSRDASLVVMNEIEKRRFDFISGLFREWNIDNTHLIYNLHAFRCLKLLYRKKLFFDFIYLDLPYVKKRELIKQYSGVLSELERYPVLKETGTIIIQHYSSNIMVDRPGIFQLAECRKYSSNSLTFYTIYRETALQ